MIDDHEVLLILVLNLLHGVDLGVLNIGILLKDWSGLEPHERVLESLVRILVMNRIFLKPLINESGRGKRLKRSIQKYVENLGLLLRWLIDDLVLLSIHFDFI